MKVLQGLFIVGAFVGMLYSGALVFESSGAFDIFVYATCALMFLGCGIGNALLLTRKEVRHG